MQIYKRGMPKERFQRPIEWYHNHWNRLYRWKVIFQKPHFCAPRARFVTFDL
jgi:hypothetical protein